VTGPRRDAGFTLIELVVALALSALVATILLHGVRVAVLGVDRQSRQSERLDARQSLDDILRHTLGAAALLPRAAGGEFVGKPDSIEFLGIAEDSGPGLYRFDLAVDRTRADRALILKRRLAAASGEPRIAASILAANVRDFHLAYFGADGTTADPAWHDRWEELNILPLMVRVILDNEGEASRPPLVVRLWNAGG
jgi:prepilin-type N-terminal cleavage/methylation domain-containing protein